LVRHLVRFACRGEKGSDLVAACAFGKLIDARADACASGQQQRKEMNMSEDVNETEALARLMDLSRDNRMAPARRRRRAGTASTDDEGGKTFSFSG
jgi:hypothetical protein